MEMQAAAPAAFGVPLDFILFALTLLGAALFHHHTLRVALVGLAAITLYKLAFTGFKTGDGVAGLIAHLSHEWVILANLLCLQLGFALRPAGKLGIAGETFAQMGEGLFSVFIN